MELKDLIKRAKEVQSLYRKFNEKKGHKGWDASAYTQGLVGDVGDLMKLVMAKNNLRDGEDINRKLAHELSDCLWSIIVIAGELEIDLEKEFLATMTELEGRVK
jgi:NTP pyrophosphatase (non-canonical NTP hydrolase)